MKTAFVLIVVLIPLPLWAQTAVWKVSNADHYLYIGGTVHLLSSDDYPLPNAYEAAYIDATTLAFETDIEALETPEFQRLLLAKNVYPEGTTLKTVLSQAVYSRLNQYLFEKNIPLEMLNNFKPGMLASVLAVMELQKLGLADEGVDVFFSKRAIRDKRPRLALESVATQIDFLSSMAEGSEDEFIEYMISDLNNLATEMAEIKTLWRQGEQTKATALIVDPITSDFPDIYRILIQERNLNWLPQLQKMLSTPTVEFVLVGYAHLLGDNGLLTLLANAGATVEQLQ